MYYREIYINTVDTGDRKDQCFSFKIEHKLCGVGYSSHEEAEKEAKAFIDKNFQYCWDLYYPLVLY